MAVFKCLCLLWILCFPSITYSTTTDYLNQVCNVASKVLETGLRLESNTALSYSANTDCYYHVITDSSKIVYLFVRKFELETEVNGVCVDYVNIHAGNSVNSATLNSSPLCGIHRRESFYRSTGNEMTIHFHTDARGQAKGFEFIFSAVTTGTCSSSQTACNNTNVCIDSSLKCNTVDECGDDTDEAGCVYPGESGIDLHRHYILIISLVLGGILFVTLCVVIGHLLWRHHKWRWFIRKSITADKVELQSTTYDTAYPVTKVYYKEKYQSMYRDVDWNQQPSVLFGYQIEHLSESSDRSNVQTPL